MPGFSQMPTRMPMQSSAMRIQLISACLDVATKTLDAIFDTLETPHLLPISITVKSLLKLTETVKQNRSECARLLEQIHVVLHGVISLHLKAEGLAPSTLGDITDLLGTLHKIYKFIEEQQDRRRINKIFRQNQTNTLLKECQTGLKRALMVINIRAMNHSEDIYAMKIQADERHQQVLELIASFSETTSSDASSVSDTLLNSQYNSSTSFSMLPSKPKIFHGRDLEVSSMIDLLTHPSPRIAILGPGGMGKTALAKVILHHPAIVDKYSTNRFFIPGDSVLSKRDFVALIGLHIGLEPRASEREVPQHLSDLSHCLLILDNLETVWEAYESRIETERFLALIASVESLALMITMRGAERPAQVAWTQPFLKPLQPLSQNAALRTFLQISDSVHDGDDIAQLLALTDNMPLAIDLLAHLVDSEGCSAVLASWERKKTSIISWGYDRRSNLDISIALSLSSPRLSSVAGAEDLLALLSILPDGLTDTGLFESKISTKNILACKAALLCTSLAYTDQQRLKVLAPVREYMQSHHPPSSKSTEALFQTYSAMLESVFIQEQFVPLVSVNFGNIQSILRFRLWNMETDLTSTIHAAIRLNRFSRIINDSDILIMAQIHTTPVQPPDPRLEVCLAIDCLHPFQPTGILDLETLVSQTLTYFPLFNDSILESRFYQAVGEYYRAKCEPATAMSWFQKAFQVATSAGNSLRQASALGRLAWIQHVLCDHTTAQLHAIETQYFARNLGGFIDEASALMTEASCLQSLGRYPESLALFKKAQIRLASCDMSGGQLDCSTPSHLAELYFFKSEYNEAQRILMQFLNSDKKSVIAKPFSLVLLAGIGVETGSPVEDVKDNINRAKEAFKQAGMEAEIIWCNIFDAALYLREGNMVSAQGTLMRTLRSSLGKYGLVTTYCLEKLGDTKLWSFLHWTYNYSTILLAFAFKAKQKLQIYKAFQFLGDLAFFEGDHNTAASLFTVALEGFTYMNVPRSRAECMLQLGNIMHSNENYQKSEKFWKAAHHLFEHSSQGNQAFLVNKKLEAANKA